MRKVFLFLIILPLSLICAQFAVAVPPNAPVVAQIGDRIEDLQDTIDDGKETGELTRSEAKRLQKRLDRIKNHFERVRRGPMPLPLVDEINRKLDMLEDDIFKQKHDPQKVRG